MKHEKGFSLLELSVAIGIAAIIAVVGVTASTVFLNNTTETTVTYKASAEQQVINANASFDALWEGQLPPSTPLDVEVSNVGVNTATLTWKPPAKTSGSGDVENYQVRLNGEVITTLEPNILAYSFTNLTYSSSYTVAVTAVNPIGATTSPGVTFNTTARPISEPLTPLAVNVSDITTGTATVNWSAPASQGDNSIDRSVVNYEVSLDGEIIAILNPDVFSYELTGLLYAKAYQVTVAASNTAGSTTALPVNFNTTQRPLAAPLMPLGVAVSDVTANTATVTWNAPASQGDNNIDRTVASYEVRVGEILITTVDPNVFTFNLTNLAYSSNFNVTVTAVNSEGSASTLPVNFATTGRPLAAPLTPLGVNVSNITTQSATVNWSAPASQGDNSTDRTVENYQVRVNDTLVTTVDASTFSVNLTGLTYSTSYSVTVTATNTAGGTATLPVSFATTARPLAAPLMPLGVAVSNITANTATVTWSAPASQGDNNTDRTVANYEVRVGSTLVTTVDASTFSVNLTGLTYSTSYSVTVTATNTAGDSATLPFGFNTTARPIAAPNAPTNIAVSNITLNGATVTWSAPA
jgi:prepilin-type N-terminal cleavage/methylation domain-containing protein